MDNFELKSEPKIKRKPVIWNILTVVVLSVTCGFAYAFLQVFLNPGLVAPYGLQPPALPTPFVTPTYTPSLIMLPATWTPTLTLTPQPTRTKAPTWTPVSQLITPTITNTPTITTTATAAPTAMPASAAFTYLASTSITTHADSACKWMGIGGKVLDEKNQPLTFQTVQLGGSLAGAAVSDQVISGYSPAYGTSGFEFKPLSDHPIASTKTIWVQLFDNKGTPLTDKVYFDTYDDCARNLVMIIFTKMR